ncbi:MAG: FecR domain-containing protein [Prolixibacteraceae bacterium]
MMIDRIKIDELADKWLKGTITEEEKQYFEGWYNREAGRHPEWSRDLDEQTLKKRLLAGIFNKIEVNEQAEGKTLSDTHRRKQLYKWSSVAAAAVVIFAIGTWLFQRHDPSYQTENKQSNVQIDLPPGREAAILTLADGSKIDLDSTQNGDVTVQGKTVISKQGGQVAYTPGEKKKGPVLYNTITTSRGNQYKVVLSDSTRVWLNSASSLHYPATFSGDARLVELTGEAYFEVAKNASMPFRVKVNGIEVEVLGTHFNINAYADEGVMETTLLEGSVKVMNDDTFVLIKPGEKAAIRNQETQIAISEADLDQVMAWRNGFFEFDDTELPAIMRQISRWYNVDIRYEGQPGDKKFGGRISKKLNLGNILTLLEANGVQFALDGQTLVVKP